MRALWILTALALVGAPIALLPTASAQPCEILGCQIVGAAACAADKVVTGEMDSKWWLVDCMTGTA